MSRGPSNPSPPNPGLSEPEICRLYLAGMGTPQIERLIGRSQCYVDAVLKRGGISKRRPGRQAGAPRPERRKPPATRKSAVELYEAGKSAREVAGILGVGRHLVASAVRDSGAHMRRQPFRLTPDMAARYEDGASTYDLASDIGVQRSTIARALARAGVAIRQPVRSSLDAEVVERYRGGESIARIADELGFHKAFGFTILRRNNVEIRRIQVRLSAAERSAVANRYEAGEQTEELMDAFGVSRTTVLNAVRDAGLGVRTWVPRLTYSSPIAGDIRPCGTWELAYARILDEWWSSELIKKWMYEADHLMLPSGKIYIPDFKVVGHDGTWAYHEIKGRMWHNAALKIKEARALGHQIVLVRRRLLGPLAARHGVEVVL